MFADGITLKGSYHKINQDNFKCLKLDKGVIAVLSDGLGSKRFSHIGSEAVCLSAAEIAKSLRNDLTVISPIDFVYKTYCLWKNKLSAYDLQECCATMLAVIIYSGRGFALRLGDGFLGISGTDGISVLYDKKADSFINETDCFGNNFNMENMESKEFCADNFNGAVMCSDGINIGTMSAEDLICFTREFISGYKNQKRSYISADISSWLQDWDGCDDKTLVYLFS